MRCDDSDFDPYEFADEFSVRRRTSYSCSDRMCGALDCSNCRPELQRLAECACCGAEHALWEEWFGGDGDLCEACAEKVQCSCCGEWFEAGEVSEEGLCAACSGEDEKKIAG